MSFKKPTLDPKYYGPNASNCGNKIKGLEKLAQKEEKEDED